MLNQDQISENKESVKSFDFMAYKFSQPIAEFCPDTDSWKLWKERLEIYHEEVECTDNRKKKTTLLKLIGSETYTMLHCLCDPISPIQKTYEEFCGILEAHYTPYTVLFKERKVFHESSSHNHESVLNWYARVKKLSINCKFGMNLDAFILNQFIMGLPTYIFETMCEENENLTLTKTLEKAITWETKINSINGSERDINFVKNQSRNFKESRRSVTYNINKQMNINRKTKAAKLAANITAKHAVTAVSVTMIHIYADIKEVNVIIVERLDTYLRFASLKQTKK